MGCACGGCASPGSFLSLLNVNGLHVDASIDVNGIRNQEFSAMLGFLITAIGGRVRYRVPVLVTTLAAGCCMSLGGSAYATDLSGAWATGATTCSKVFVKKGSEIAFQPGSDEYGGGFILEGNRVRGQMQTCNIKARKEDGNVVHILAACAGDIMASDVQLSARIIDDNTILRFFPGMPDDLSISYSRCSL